MRLAEELAMIDMISKGRLVSGFVRGGGQEQLATGVNPAYNRERFEEAHDLIVKTWTAARPVPLGGHALPAPRGQSVGGAAAEALSARVDPGRASARRRSSGRRSSAIPTSRSTPRSSRPRRSGSSTTRRPLRSATSRRPGELRLPDPASTSPDNEEKAIENARQFMWMQGEFTGLAHPVWGTPSGYFSPTDRRAFVEFAAGRASNPRGNPTFEQQMRRPRDHRRHAQDRWSPS